MRIGIGIELAPRQEKKEKKSFASLIKGESAVNVAKC
jgi:hypothetical protein